MRSYIGNKITSPAISIIVAYVYIGILAVVLYLMGFYSNSTFFSWGVPVTFMGVVVTSYTNYFLLLFLLFLHQMINNWTNSTIYPWIINSVQNDISNHLIYSKKVSMVLVNMFALYSELDMIFLVSGMVSQITFVIAIILANFITTTVINWQYIKKKIDFPMNEYSIV